MMFLNWTRDRLQPTAVPTLFDIPNPPKKIGVKRKLVFRDDSGKYFYLDFFITNPTIFCLGVYVNQSKHLYIYIF